MNISAIAKRNKGLSYLSTLLLGAVLLVGLQACGGSSSDKKKEVIDANPAGYYTGTASIKDPADGVSDLVLSDVKAMVNGTRFMVMSESTPILYDGTITDITGNDFTANVTIYHNLDGDSLTTPTTPISTTLSGTITEGSQITGVIAGTGIGTGNFSLTYSLTNSTASDTNNIIGRWNGDINSVLQGPSFEFEILNSNGDIELDVGDQATAGFYETCLMSGSATPVVNSALFTISIDITGSCAFSLAMTGNYTGLATTTDVDHNVLVIAFSDGATSFTAEFDLVP